MKNIVFDCGQVLVHFDPVKMTEKYVSDTDDIQLLSTVVFDRLYWDRLDAGTITNEETMERVKERLPKHLWEVADKLYYEWIYNIPEIEGMRELIEHIKKTYGVSTYLLSNISNYFADHANEIRILDLIDDCVFSARCKLVKPDQEIFEYLCKTYDLDPKETFFIDDKAANIEAGKRYGIDGYVFDGDVKKLWICLDELLK